MARDRRVQHAAARLARAVTSTQVAGVLVEAGLDAVGAISGALVMLTDDRRELRLIHAVGHMPERSRRDQRFPLTARFPLVEAVRSERELWLATAEDLISMFPELVPEPGACAWAVLPLIVDGMILGAVGWSFAARGFTVAQRAALCSLARAGGEALFRAGLYEVEQRAQVEAENERHTLSVQLATAVGEKTEAELARRRDALMAEVSNLLDSASDAAALSTVARLSLPLLGHWCAINVLDDSGDGHLRLAASAHADPDKEGVIRHASRARGGITGRLTRSLSAGKAALIPNLALGSSRGTGLSVNQVRYLRQIELSRILVVPMRFQGRTLGTVIFGAEGGVGRYDAAQVALAQRFARRCAASIAYRELHDRAQKAAQAREDFVALTSHELRTPLSHIKGFVSTLRTTDTDWDPATRDDFLAEIENEADRLATLIENLLNMSRIDSTGQDPAARSATQPEMLVAAGVDRVRGSLGDHPLEIDIEHDLPAVWVDSSQVERVIANLLDNAVKYSPPAEPIGLSAHLAGDEVCLRIEDRGLGIPLAHVERIFEPFFREPTAGYPAKPGTGLGLAICRSIVRAQQGRIWAEQRPGGGAAFVFTLPVAAPTRPTEV
jgi:signal transduction histidine kinase